jgi:predicted nucleotidyltransferase
VAAVREAAAQGLSQQQIATAIGRSQPEVSRLLRFHGVSPLSRRLRSRTKDVKRIIRQAGGRDVRVFGSVARGEDGPGSDIDLLFRADRAHSLMELGRVERDLSALLGAPVDLVPEASLKPGARDRILQEAVTL